MQALPLQSLSRCAAYAYLVGAQRAWLFTILTPPSTISCRRGTSKLVAPTCFTLPLACSGNNQRGLAPYTQQSRATGPPKGGLIPGGACMLPLAGMQGAVLSQSVACVWRRATHLQRRQVLCCLHIPLAGVVVPVELQGDRGCGWGGVGAERGEGGWHWVEVGVGVGRAERVGSSWTDAQGENGPLQCKAAEPATNTAAARVAPTTNKPARVGANCYAGSILYVGIFLYKSSDPHLHQVQRIHLQPLPAGVNALHTGGGGGAERAGAHGDGSAHSNRGDMWNQRQAQALCACSARRDVLCTPAGAIAMQWGAPRKPAAPTCST